MSIRYDFGNKHHFIFQNCILETFTKNNSRNFGINNTKIKRLNFLEKYILKNPNCEYLMQNSDCLYILLADLSNDKLIKEGELTWKQFLYDFEIDNQCNYIALGYALIVTNICKLTGIKYQTIELIEIFFRQKNLMSLLIDRLIYECEIYAIPKNILCNSMLWEIYEKKTAAISSNFDCIFNCTNEKDIQDIITINNLNWTKEFTLLVINQLKISN